MTGRQKFKARIRTLARGSGPVGPLSQQWGTVRSIISGSVNAVGVTLGAATTPVLVVRYDSSYVPGIGDTVAVHADDKGVLFVAGKPA